MSTSFRDPVASAVFEPLEPRLLLGGNVTVVVSHGDLRIQGDRGDNVISVAPGGGADPTEYVITGFDGTTINGDPAKTVVGVTDDFRIRMARGRNEVELAGLTVPDNLRITARGGQDDVRLDGVIVQGNTVITTRGGDDLVLIENNSELGAKATINAGPGADRVGLADADVAARTKIKTQGGPDVVHITNSNFNGPFRLITGPGGDVVQIVDAEIRSTSAIKTGGGGDDVTVTDSDFTGTCFVSTGWGGDALLIDPTVFHGGPGVFQGRDRLRATRRQHGAGDGRRRLQRLRVPRQGQPPDPRRR